MNPRTCSVAAYCFVVLAINSVAGRPGRDLVTTICSFRTDSAGSLNGLSQQDLKDLIFRGGVGGFDRLSPQELEDLNSWSSSPGIFDGLNLQQLKGFICTGTRKAGDFNQITRTPYKFEYQQQDVLQMDISFKLPSDVTGGFVSLRYSSIDHRPKYTFEIRRPYDETGDPVVHVRDILSGERVYIDVQLFNKTGLHSYQKISEGKKTFNSSDTDYAYNSICLNGNRCQIKIELRKEFEAIFAIAMFVIGIVAFIKYCWIKRDAPEILQEPLQPTNPFYVNLLYRKEWQKIIDDLEENHYELIY